VQNSDLKYTVGTITTVIYPFRAEWLLYLPRALTLKKTAHFAHGCASEFECFW